MLWVVPWVGVFSLATIVKYFSIRDRHIQIGPVFKKWVKLVLIPSWSAFRAASMCESRTVAPCPCTTETGSVCSRSRHWYRPHVDRTSEIVLYDFWNIESSINRTCFNSYSQISELSHLWRHLVERPPCVWATLRHNLRVRVNSTKTQNGSY